ncbi:uncharacterized protein LOC144135009 [Amblyomma americanum]
MPLIIIGVVVLVAVAGVGVFLATSGPSDEGSGSTTAESGGPGGPGGPDGPPGTGGDSAIDPSNWTYFGAELGPLNSNEHGVSGKVYAATDSLICITEFNYDGTGPDAEVMAGATDTPDQSGEVLMDVTKKASRRSSGGIKMPKLEKLSDAKLVFKLSKKINEYKYISIFSKTEQKSYGEIKASPVFEAPSRQDCSSFQNPEKNVASTANTILDSKRMKLAGFHLDGNVPNTVILVGRGEIKSPNGKPLTEALEEYTGKDLEVALSDGTTWDQYEWISVYCLNVNVSFGHFNIPSPLKVPVNVGGSGSSRPQRAVQRRVRLGNLNLKPGSGTGKPKVLLCTFGEFGVRSSMVPPDGMCDIIFFTDVEYDNDKGAIVPTNEGPAFGVLQSAAKKYTKTTFGTSMSTGAIAEAVKDKADALKASMDEIFKARLLHFGMLNVENIENYDTLKGTDLKYLKVVADFLKTKVPHRRYHNALGISLRDASKGDKILEVAKLAPRDFPGLTMIVVKLHTENVDNGGDHWPVAPNPDGVDLTDHNALSLASIKDEVKKQLLDVAKHGRYAMLSFAMYARTYRMKASWSKVSVRETSETSLNMEYAAVCKMKAEKDSSDHGTMYIADQQKKFLALFDSPSTFKAKTKARLNVMPKNFTGLAVYNVEMDDSEDACGKGRFPRLRAIKAALAA